MSINNQENIIFSLLHKAGCSHKDLHILANFRENPQIFIEKFLQKDGIFLQIFGEKKCEKIAKNLKEINFENYKNFIENEQIKIISFLDSDFPESLKHIFTIPFLLYTKGQIKTNQKTLGIVGSRKNTNYGISALSKITEKMPKNYSIISGGAYGIDSLAHETAIEQNLHTIAVFGCGINIIYPKSNASLFEKILAKNGWLLSIFPIDTPPDAYNFPIRNEIVAWLSDKILIPEASLKSWTLITAQLANDLGKEVFAIPGDIFRSTSEGCNHLINRGEAFCTIQSSDIFEEKMEIIENLSLDNLISQEEKSREIFAKNFESETAKLIFEQISTWNNSVDLLLKSTNLDISQLTIELTLLEINGDISQTSPGFYTCIFN